jgi:hypothetical protein
MKSAPPPSASSIANATAIRRHELRHYRQPDPVPRFRRRRIGGAGDETVELSPDFRPLAHGNTQSLALDAEPNVTPAAVAVTHTVWDAGAYSSALFRKLRMIRCSALGSASPRKPAATLACTRAFRVSASGPNASIASSTTRATSVGILSGMMIGAENGNIDVTRGAFGSCNRSVGRRLSRSLYRPLRIAHRGSPATTRYAVASHAVGVRGRCRLHVRGDTGRCGKKRVAVPAGNFDAWKITHTGAPQALTLWIERHRLTAPSG